MKIVKTSLYPYYFHKAIFCTILNVPGNIYNRRATICFFFERQQVLPLPPCPSWKHLPLPKYKGTLLISIFATEFNKKPLNQKYLLSRTELCTGIFWWLVFYMSNFHLYLIITKCNFIRSVSQNFRKASGSNLNDKNKTWPVCWFEISWNKR